eukprot:UN02255
MTSPTKQENNTKSFNDGLNRAIKLIKTEVPLRSHSCPKITYDDCREFDSFAGEWVDSNGETVSISPWGVIRYPINPKLMNLRFESTYLGPHHLSFIIDKDINKTKRIGKLSHDKQILIWMTDTKWVKKGSKYDPKFHNVKRKWKWLSSPNLCNVSK